MRKTFIIGVGGLLLLGLLGTQSWAGSMKADMVCLAPMPGVGKVTITAKGDVKGFIRLSTRLGAPRQLTCDIYCGTTLKEGPALCVDAPAGTKTLKIKALGLGAGLGGTCFQPAVEVGVDCESAYISPGP